MRPSAAADPQDGRNPHQEPPDRQKRANQKNDRDVASPEIQTRLPSAEAFPHGQDPKWKSTCGLGNETASQRVFARMARFRCADDHLGSVRAGASASPIHLLAQALHLFIGDPVDIPALDASILQSIVGKRIHAAVAKFLRHSSLSQRSAFLRPKPASTRSTFGRSNLAGAASADAGFA